MQPIVIPNNLRRTPVAAEPTPEETPGQKAARLLKEKLAAVSLNQPKEKSQATGEELDKFANWHNGDVQNWNDEMSKRGMVGGVKFTGTFAGKPVASEKEITPEYLSARKNSGIWKMELQQNVIKEAKRLGINNREGITANQEYLFKKATDKLRDFQTPEDKATIKQVFNQGVGDQTIGDNFWETTKGLYQDLTKKEQVEKALLSEKRSIAKK